MKKIECCYLTKGKRTPVLEFINSLDSWTQRKFFSRRDLLGEFGPKLPLPHKGYVRDDIYELRFKGAEGQIRLLFFFYKNKAIFTNGFIKKSRRTPKNPLRVAIRDKNNYLEKQKRSDSK